MVGDVARGRGAHAGPYARLRMENQVGAGAHVGNFVELKKTRMGEGAKANHLAYLGDSEIGAEDQHRRGHDHVQLRWDHKHPTKIGEGAFVGAIRLWWRPLLLATGRTRRRGR